MLYVKFRHQSQCFEKNIYWLLERQILDFFTYRSLLPPWAWLVQSVGNILYVQGFRFLTFTSPLSKCSRIKMMHFAAGCKFREQQFVYSTQKKKRFYQVYLWRDFITFSSSAQWHLGDVHWPQIWDLLKILPCGWCGIKSLAHRNIHRLTRGKSTYWLNFL